MGLRNCIVSHIRFEKHRLVETTQRKLFRNLGLHRDRMANCWVRRARLFVHRLRIHISGDPYVRVPAPPGESIIPIMHNLPFPNQQIQKNCSKIIWDPRAHRFRLLKISILRRIQNRLLFQLFCRVVSENINVSMEISQEKLPVDFRLL